MPGPAGLRLATGPTPWSFTSYKASEPPVRCALTPYRAGSLQRAFSPVCTPLPITASCFSPPPPTQGGRSKGDNAYNPFSAVLNIQSMLSKWRLPLLLLSWLFVIITRPHGKDREGQDRNLGFNARLCLFRLCDSGQVLHPSEPQCPHLYSGDNSPHLEELSEEVDEEACTELPGSWLE